MSFISVFEKYPWDRVGEWIYDSNRSDVERALSQSYLTLKDFAALLSPAADPYLEELAQLSQQRTRKRFGNTIQMYVPLYLSNECQNICTYCGFSYNNEIPRKTLTKSELLQEIEVIQGLGFEHVLVVTGEANKTVGMDYFERMLPLLRQRFAQVSFEVQPLDEEEYRRLSHAGVHSVLVYQETYHRENYRDYHPKGKKSRFEYRLDTPDRLGRAGIHKIGLGALIGLEDWRIDSWFVALHLEYLRKKYWRTKYSVSFPRLRPAEGFHEPKSPMSERELVQLICAYRLFDEDVELSLSTRESQYFRDNVFSLGITSVSAGSRTDPGGYSVSKKALKQFEISDERTPQEVAQVIRRQGLEPVWKDWEPSYTSLEAQGTHAHSSRV